MNFIIPLVCFPFDVMVSVDQTDKELFQILKECGNKKKDCELLFNLKDTTQGRTVLLPSNQTVIRLSWNMPQHKLVGIIAHESFHAITFLMDRIGSKFKMFTNDEVYAYLIGYLAGEIYAMMHNPERSDIQIIYEAPIFE